MQLFTFLDGLQWFPATLGLCRDKLIHFFWLFLFLIMGFALLMNITFGGSFFQYRNLGRSFYCLLLLAFGDDEQAFAELHPWEEVESTWVSGYLMVFLCVVVTVAMNFFVTIILDAYAAISDPVEAWKAVSAGNAAILAKAARYLGAKDSFDV